ncbi:MAG: S9 family peptidase [Rhodospirillales bacterium]|jgi:oligopeptidase B|nr:S9 family peptidase [Rhodospirillales bacterium]MDP6803853.1 S9 family peptidase [Rhodospirillales bacterium]
MTTRPPVAPRRPAKSVRHGDTQIDDYAWLRDDNWEAVMRDPGVLTPGIRAYLEAENAYAEAALAPDAELRGTLVQEMRARIKEDDSTVPATDGAFAYYTRYDSGGQHPVFCRHPIRGGGEEILLDANEEAKGHAFYRLATCIHSPDHRLLAYTVDLNGSEYYEVHFRDLETGTELADRMTRAQGDIVWAGDSRTVFYTVHDDHHRPSRVFRHAIGDDPDDDVLVYEESDPGFFVGIDKTESRAFVLIVAHDNTTTEVRILDADAPSAEARLIALREPGIEYDVADVEDRFLIRTNADGAEDFKIVEAPIASPTPDAWTDVVPHRLGSLIRAQLAFADHLVRLERIDGRPRIVVRRLATAEEHEIAFDEDAFELGIVPGYEFATTTLRFIYTSPTTPRRTYDYDMETRGRTLRKEDVIPSGHDPDAYCAERIFAISHDGERVPVSILRSRDAVVDGESPLLLYGYGSYGFATPASFSANRFSLVDRGFIYAIAHVRGGMERGYRWYREGKLAKKTNTFLDFIAAAEALIEAGYARAGNIAAHGGSAGGMLVGAVANMRPDLFRAIVAEVPFVDVLNTMCDAALPLTPPEWGEWGNPITDADAYRTILAYSPYENVCAQAYPSILALAGISDPRVTYWEPAKWVAKLRAIKTDDNLVVLRTNMTAGHAGASGRFDRLEEVALVYAFLLTAFERS